MDTQKNWFQRSWKWLVPLGCLGLIVLCVTFVGGILLIVSGAIKSSDVYQQALQKATSSSAVIEALGEPITPGWMPQGSINVSGPTGSADLSIPISGPKNSGTLYVVAAKAAGDWQFTRLEVAVNGQPDRINLLKEQ